MKVLILEGSENGRRMLVRIVRSCMEGIKVFSFLDSADAYLCAMNNDIDVFLVDIILDSENENDSSGIQFAESLREHSRYKLKPIIFITELAGMEAELLRKVHCYDYIEKTINDRRIIQERILQALEDVIADRKIERRESFTLRREGIYYPIYPDKVIYVVSQQRNLYIHTLDDVIEISHMSIKNFLEKLEKVKFMIPTRGTAVNIDYVKNINFRKKEIYLNGTDDVVEIGGRLKNRFREEYEAWHG